MSLTISGAATLNNNTIASGDLIPVLDISAASGSRASHISAGELQTYVRSGLNESLSGKVSTGIYISGSGLAINGGYLTGNQIINVPIASSGEAVLGTSNTVGMTPLRTAQAIAVLVSGVPSLYSISPSTGILINDYLYNNNGIIRNTLTGNATLLTPVSGTDGKSLNIWLLASGANRTLTLSGISVPTGVTFETTIASGQTRVLEITNNNSSWLLTRNLQFT